MAINLSSAFHTTRLVLPSMLAQQVGSHHQYRIGARPRRIAVQIRLCGRQARARRPHEGRPRSRRPNTASPATPSAPVTSTRHWSKRRSTARPRRTASRASKSSATSCCAQQPNKRFATVEELGALVGVPRERSRSVDHRRGLAGRRRLDRALSAGRGPQWRTDKMLDVTKPQRHRRAGRKRRMRADVVASSRDRSSWSFRAAVRSAPIRPASIRPCMRLASSRTGSSAPRSAPSTPA